MSPTPSAQQSSIKRFGVPLSQTIRRLQRAIFRQLGRLAGAQARPREADFSIAVPFAFDTGYTPQQTRRVAAICHIFYVDLAQEMLDYLQQLPNGTDVYISTTDAQKAQELQAIFAIWQRGAVTIRIAPNRGRDIAPKFITFRDVYSAGYQLVVFLHSKKTKDVTIGPNWRLALMQTLLGSTATIGSVFAAFDADPSLGMIIPQHYEPIREHSTWQNNFLHGRSLAKRMGFALRSRYSLDFAAGSMFWTRPEALKPLLDLHLRLEDFPEEDGQIGDTIAHGIERMILFICEFSGYRWVKIADPRYFESKGTMITIEDRAALARFHQEHGFNLLPSTVRAPLKG